MLPRKKAIPAGEGGETAPLLPELPRKRAILVGVSGVSDDDENKDPASALRSHHDVEEIRRVLIGGSTCASFGWHYRIDVVHTRFLRV